jgi:hypothetical protein
MLTFYLIFRLLMGMTWTEMGNALLSMFSFFAAGMFTKQADQLTARFLNDVNDSVSGGAIVSLPSGVSSPAVSATQPGDRIILDDATALALSDTSVGTLYGGIYEYVQTLSSSTAAPAVGTAAFFRSGDIGGATPYMVTADAQPTTAVPTYFQGVFINAITKGNFGWIQVAGIASCLFDSAVTAAAAGNSVSVKVSAAVASTFDVGVSVASALLYASMVGVAVTLPATSTISKVAITRFISRL